MEIEEILMLVLIIILIGAVVFLLIKITNLETANQAIIDDFNQKHKFNSEKIQLLLIKTEKPTTSATNVDASEIQELNPILDSLKVRGSVTFDSKNTNIFEIFPKYMIIAWATTTIPKGWALCDGRKYILNSSGNATESSTGTQTPDLRGRVILGSDPPSTLPYRKLNDTVTTGLDISTVDNPSSNTLSYNALTYIMKL